MARDTILIVDDDRTVVTMVGEFLRKKGFAVATGFDAMQAMIGVRQAPRAVILDVNMPGGNGIDVLRRIRSSSKSNQTPVLILTSSLDGTVADEARGLGADAFLAKPVDLEQLYASLLAALGRPAE